MIKSNSKIKILFLIHDLSVGGAEKVLVNLVNNMDKTKYDITVMALFDGGVNRQFLAENVNYISCFKRVIPGNSHLMKLLSPEQLHKWLIKDEYDLEVAYLEGPAARIISGCRNPKTKTVSWIHCTMHSKKELAMSFRSEKEAEKCYQQFDAMAFVSNEVKEAFKKTCAITGRAEVIYNTNESNRIQALAKDTEFDFSFKQNVFYWCGVGKIVANKGFDRMVRIQKRLLQEGYKVHLIALGSGQQLEMLTEWCEINEIADNVSFLGYQTNPYKYISRSNLYVCASYSEGFSTAATEALLLGIPVLTTNVSGMKEMLGENNEFGIIADNDEESLYEKFKEILDNVELYDFYREQARKRGNDFSTEQTVKDTEDFLESII